MVIYSFIYLMKTWKNNVQKTYNFKMLQKYLKSVTIEVIWL